MGWVYGWDSSYYYFFTFYYIERLLAWPIRKDAGLNPECNFFYMYSKVKILYASASNVPKFY